MKTKLNTVITALLTALFTELEQSGFAQTPTANMVWIPARTFTMGDTFNEGGFFTDERPTHAVYVSGFYIDKYEVAKALWDSVKAWNGGNGYGYNYAGSAKAADHPIRSLNWYDCVKWCNARSQKEGLIPCYYTDAGLSVIYKTGQVDPYVKWGANGYRLPTEAEWEKAARGGASGHRFSWSDANTITHSRANYYSRSSYSYDISPTRGYHPTFAIGYQPYTSPVGYFLPNGYGLYDMTGNVWEWCWDWYQSSWYSQSGATQNDTRGPAGSSGFRVLRGGGWGDAAYYSRCSYRNSYPIIPSYPYDGIGFRSVLQFYIPQACLQVIGTQTTEPTYGSCPVREVGKDNLILVTHGWNPDVRWLEAMTNAIQVYLDSRGLNSWKVVAYKWVEKATVSVTGVIGNAVQEGESLGKGLRAQAWSHIHFIAHSAGSGLIQAATDYIKDTSLGTPPTTVIHSTFLDAYVGTVYWGRSKYGQSANWADSYFSRDKETFGEFWQFTEGPLDNCYNVDITWLDPNKSTLDVYYSTGSGVLQTCIRTITSHQYPHTFYANTIPPNSVEGSAGFGFLLSKEANGWDTALSYAHNNNPPRVLGTPDPPCVEYLYTSTPAVIGPTVNFSTTPSQQSLTGLIVKNSGSVRLTTDSPAWLASFIALTNPANIVSFNAQFTSTAYARGLLSVYWDTNTIGSVDELTVLPGLRRYTFAFPRAESNSVHTLGFRLDAFTNIQSSVNITNVTLGFFGVSQPFRLSVTTNTIGGLHMFQLTGQSGFTYTVETSTNLVNWETVAILANTNLANTNGTVRFVDTGSTNARARFYRALAP